MINTYPAGFTAWMDRQVCHVCGGRWVVAYAAKNGAGSAYTPDESRDWPASRTFVCAAHMTPQGEARDG